MRILDLFCGGGGIAQGYYRPGDDITGVDLYNQKRYPFNFIKADAMTFPLEGYDMVHASPPCQGHSTMRNFEHQSESLLIETLRRLRASDVPIWVVENVMGVTYPYDHDYVICGASLGRITRDGSRLYLSRHRKFWSNKPVQPPACSCKWWRKQGWQCAGVYGDPGRVNPGWGYKAKPSEARQLMGIDWLPWREMKEAIPPSYGSFIRAQLDRAGSLAEVG